MSESETIGVTRISYTVSHTFTNKPSDKRRQQLKDAGYRFENGHWYKNQTEGRITTEETLDQIIAA